MGVLGLVLPGVREIRTPLVVGWLWIGMLWLSAGLLPMSWYDLPAHVASPSWFNQLGPAAKVAILSIAAFFLGVAVKPLQEWLIWSMQRVFRILFIVALIVFVTAILSFFLNLLRLVIDALFALAVISLVAYHFRIRRLTAADLINFLERCIDAMTTVVESRFDALRFRHKSSSVSDYWGVRRDIRLYIANQIDGIARKNHGSIESLIRSADNRVLIAIAERMIFAFDPELTIDYDNGSGPGGPVTIDMLQEAIDHATADPDARYAVESFVASELLLSQSSRLDLYLTFLNLDDWEEALMQEMDSLATELQVQASAVYQDWDRYVNERDFRVSCSVPIALASIAIAVWSAIRNGFSRQIFTWNSAPIHDRLQAIAHIFSGAPANFLIAGLAFIGAVIIYRSGVASGKRANDLMISCLGRGVVKSSYTPASMDLASLSWKSRHLHLSLARRA